MVLIFNGLSLEIHWKNRRTVKINAPRKVPLYVFLASLMELDEGTFDKIDYCCCNYNNDHTDSETKIEENSQTSLERLNLLLHDVSLFVAIDSSKTLILIILVSTEASRALMRPLKRSYRPLSRANFISECSIVTTIDLRGPAGCRIRQRNLSAFSSRS